MTTLFIGGGNMAAAMIGGLIGRGIPGADLHVVELRAEAREDLRQRFGVNAHAAPDAACTVCDAIVLAVKPQQMREVARQIAPHLGSQLVVSIAAGIRLGDLARWLGGYSRLVRVMPNTPALIGAGISGLHALPAVDATGRAQAEAILQAVGNTFWVDDEARMDSVTAVTGSGPAYVFMFIEALQSGALAMGFDPATAHRMAVDTVLGAARLAESSSDSPAELRVKVTSKGGTTEAALAVMQQRAVVDGIVAGMRAAEARGRELGELLGRES